MLGRGMIGWLTILLLPTIGLGQSDRLQVYFKGKATLSVSGDVPSCGFFTSCPLDESYCSSFWDLCSGGTRTVSAPGSYVVLGGEIGGSFGYSSNAQLTVRLLFSFRYSPPLLQIAGFSYTPKTSLGFAYFVDGVKAGAAAIAVAGCHSSDLPCCESGSASASAMARVSTSVAQASISSSKSASCGCADAELCLDCTSDGGAQWRTDPEDSSGYRGYKASSVSFRHSRSASHTEELMGFISLSGSSTECGGALSVGAAFAYAGLLLQSAPHPLGVPAVGENEYVWTSDTPAKLEIPARAYAYAWGWEPDLGWFADNTLFRVEPPIESERTQPGFRTIARGRELIAQSRDQYGAIDDLVFVRSHLPPSNKDFGKKNVYFVVEGNKVDYAEVEIFFPPDATNHPPDDPEGYVMLLENPDERCPRWRRLRRVDTPNWFYYYWDAYGRPDRVYYLAAAHGVTQDPSAFYDILNDEIYIGDRVHPVYGTHTVYLFRLERRLDSQGRRRQLITYVDQLEPRGIHQFIALLEHEKSHRKYYTARISRCDWGPQQDPDSDSLPSWWERMHGLDPRRRDTTKAFRFDPDGDSDAVAEIEAFGALERAKKYWRYDWAQYSMQWGIPPSPFPWRYVSSGTNISRYDRYLLRMVPRTGGR